MAYPPGSLGSIQRPCLWLKVDDCNIDSGKASGQVNAALGGEGGDGRPTRVPKRGAPCHFRNRLRMAFLLASLALLVACASAQSSMRFSGSSYAQFAIVSSKQLNVFLFSDAHTVFNHLECRPRVDQHLALVSRGFRQRRDFPCQQFRHASGVHNRLFNDRVEW